MVRCKACGFLMKEGKLGDRCPACGAPKTAFEPYKDPMAWNRRRARVTSSPAAIRFGKVPSPKAAIRAKPESTFPVVADLTIIAHERPQGRNPVASPSITFSAIRSAPQKVQGVGAHADPDRAGQDRLAI